MKKKTARFSPRVAIDEETTVCLVAGGAGFVGSYLCEILVGQNCFVYCLDNFSTGRQVNLARIKKHPQFAVLEHDLNSREKLKLPRKVDYVFHVAGVEAYTNGLDVSLETLLVNSFGTKTLLELARDNQAKFLLASSEQVYSGFLSEQSLASYFGKTRTMEAESAFAEAKRFAEALVFEYVKKHQVNARIVRLDFLYGPRINLEAGSILAKLFQDAAKGRIEVPGNGLTRLYPTYITDAVYGLVKTMFSQASKGRIYTLVDPKMVTILNFAYHLRDQLGEGTKIEFTKGDDLYNFEFPQKSVLDSQELLGWYPKVEAKEGVKLTLDWFLEQKKIGLPKPDSEAKVEEIKTEKKEEKKAPSFISQTQPSPAPIDTPKEKPQPQVSDQKISFNWLRRLPLAFLALFLILLLSLLPLAGFVWVSYQGAVSLKQAQEALLANEIETMARFSRQAQKNFTYANLFLKKFSWLIAKVGLGTEMVMMDQALQTGRYLAEATDQLWLVFESGKKLMAIALDREPGDPAQQLQAMQTNLDQLNIKLGFAEAELNQVMLRLEGKKLFGPKKEFKKIQQNLPQWRRQVIEAKQMLTILPGLLRFYDKQTFLVLLQDNQELRPTGGFIGSYALITIEEGKIIDFTAEDIYTADSQLKGYIKPPDAIKRYLGEDVWWFRDSNISPDFPTSAARGSWFLEKEVKREVIGVIGTNLDLMKNLLTATGPVYLPDYKEKIDANNVFEKAEYHSEVNFSPGLTKKKDFLGSLIQALFENIKQLESDQIIGLAQMLIKSLNEKAVMVWLPGGEEANLLSQYGWDGGLRTPPETLPEFEMIDLTDYLMPVEANFGVNKANFFISRQTDHQVTILKDGRLLEKFTLKLTNNSLSEAWPGGTYKNYFRLYAPSDAQLEKVIISHPKNKEIKILKKREYEIRRELGKQVFGFLVEIPAKEEREITVEYRRAKKLPVSQSQLTYLFYWQKQSGITDDRQSLVINYPMFLKPIKMSQQAAFLTQSLKFTTDSRQDRLFAVTFSR